MPDLNKQIKVSVVKAPTNSIEAAEQSAPLSIYIYIAGLVVSLSGMYAATYSMADTNFALVLRSLVVCGYCVSYWLRRNNIDLKQYQAPLLVVFATVMYFVASTAPELSSATSSNGTARPYQIQVVVIWITVLQSFTLCADSAILFACVPSMALIGIMSSGTPDTEVQYAFFVFLAAATFLMVHENHLRTRSAMAHRNRSAMLVDNRIFRGEIVLVGCCIIGTMMLATLVQTPIEIVGRALIPANPQDLTKSSQSKQNPASTNILVDEGVSVDLGTGPVTESDVSLLSISSKAPIPYLRGATYDYYTGQRFEDRLSNARTVASDGRPHGAFRGQASQTISPMGGSGMHIASEINIDPELLDSGIEQMEGSQTVVADVTVLGGTITHLYGPPVFKTVYTQYDSLVAGKNGALSVRTPMVQGQNYEIISNVPADNPAALQAASTNYPASVTDHYLQVTNAYRDRNQKLQSFSDEVTRGKTNSYDKVVALRDAISSQCSYNLQSPAIPRDRDVVEAFLFDVKQGYCDSFAAALTVLCRYQNIPARLASGFIQGDKQNDGSFVVREKHKHAWTEVYFTNIGWIPFDATAGTVDSSPSNAPAVAIVTSPLRWLRSHGPIPPLIAIIVLVLIGYVLKAELLSRFHRSTGTVAPYALLPASNMEIVQVYHDACSALAKSGLSRDSHLTPSEFRLGVHGYLPAESEAGPMLDRITDLHQTFVYGCTTASEADVTTARAALVRLTAAVALLPKFATVN